MMRALPLAPLLLVVGCGPTVSNAPSLLPRPIESRSDAIEAPAATPSLPPDAALAATIDGLVGQARSSAARFTAALAGAERAAAGSGRAGTEIWVTAQQRLSDLEVAHGPAAAALNELDETYVAQVAAAGEGGAAVGIDALRDARDTVAAIADAQQAALARIKAKIGQ